jgi:hypothetical protein
MPTQRGMEPSEQQNKSEPSVGHRLHPVFPSHDPIPPRATQATRCRLARRPPRTRAEPSPAPSASSPPRLVPSTDRPPLPSPWGRRRSTRTSSSRASWRRSARPSATTKCSGPSPSPSLPHRPYGGFISLRITVARYVASDPTRFPLSIPSVRPSIFCNRLGA